MQAATDAKQKTARMAQASFKVNYYQLPSVTMLWCILYTVPWLLVFSQCVFRIIPPHNKKQMLSVTTVLQKAGGTCSVDGVAIDAVKPPALPKQHRRHRPAADPHLDAYKKAHISCKKSAVSVVKEMYSPRKTSAAPPPPSRCYPHLDLLTYCHGTVGSLYACNLFMESERAFLAQPLARGAVLKPLDLKPETTSERERSV